MSSRALHTGLTRPGVVRPRKKVSFFPTTQKLPPEAPVEEARELWVAVHLPWLPVEAISPAVAGRSAPPQAVVELQGQTQFIVSACERAQRHGVRPGMSMAAALALIPELVTLARDPVREQQLLERLATRAHRFTPRVSLVPPEGLLLEVKGSLHLFGGAEALVRQIEQDYVEAGVKPLLALAPSPLAALAGARAGKPLRITRSTHLIGQIAPISLLTLRWPHEVIERLRQVGVYTIGQALRLPRAGFARRFGKAQLADLDRLTGKGADLRQRFHVRERFRHRHDLLVELEHHDALLAALEPGLGKLGEFLQSRQCGITRLDCLLTHRHAPATRLTLRLAAPAASAGHFAKLLGERLAKEALPEPVRAIEIRSGSLVSRAPALESLWRPGEHGGGVSPAAPELIEQLRARLGHEAVHGLEVRESHCPERAWGKTDLLSMATPKRSRRPAANASSVPWPSHRRPVWLLREPERLGERGGLPHRHGRLEMLEGPERIETGWWEGEDVARDYYVARDSRGVKLWLFRERRAPHRWFLHGVFG